MSAGFALAPYQSVGVLLKSNPSVHTCDNVLYHTLLQKGREMFHFMKDF